jgi:hypothetical protein
VGKPEGIIPLGRPRYRWVEDNKMDLGEVGWDSMDQWKARKHGNKPSGSIICRKILE